MLKLEAVITPEELETIALRPLTKEEENDPIDAEMRKEVFDRYFPSMMKIAVTTHVDMSAISGTIAGFIQIERNLRNKEKAAHA